MSNRPPGCDLPPEFYKQALKECPFCGSNHVEVPRGITWGICRNSDCNSEGPINDPHGRKWNSIPRRSEVAELLRLVGEVTVYGGALVDTRNFPDAGGCMVKDLEQLQNCADKLKKEWNL